MRGQGCAWPCTSWNRCKPTLPCPARPPCMINQPTTESGEHGSITGAESGANRLRTRRPAADRPPSGALDSVGELDRNRTRAFIPNSRKSRCSTTSSHSLGREFAMSEYSACIFLAVDVAKDSAEVCCLPKGRNFTPRDPAHLVQELASLGTCFVVLEATGGYERPWATALLEADIRVAVVNPKRVRDFAKAIGHLAKTDHIDAFVIARYAQVANPRPLEKPHPKQAEMQDLVNRRRQLLNMHTMEENRRATVRSSTAKRSIDAVLRTFKKE